METLTLPLFIVACLQALVTLLLILPVKSISLSVANSVTKACKAEFSRPVIATISVLLLVLFGSGVMEILRGSGSSSPRVDLMGEVDHLRAQVTCFLSMMNVLLLLLNQALAFEKRQFHLCSQNLEAMKRQVKGLQTEYERVTADDNKGGGDGTDATSASTTEIAALKKHVDKLIQEKIQIAGEVDVAVRAKASAEAKSEALLSQIKGFDKEFDRVLDENKALKAKAEAGNMGGGMLGGTYSKGKAE